MKVSDQYIRVLNSFHKGNLFSYRVSKYAVLNFLHFLICLCNYDLTPYMNRDHLKRTSNHINSELTSFYLQYNFILASTLGYWDRSKQEHFSSALNHKWCHQQHYFTSSLLRVSHERGHRLNEIAFYRKTEWHFPREYWFENLRSFRYDPQFIPLWQVRLHSFLFTLKLLKGSLYLQHPRKHFAFLLKIFSCIKIITLTRLLVVFLRRTSDNHSHIEIYLIIF